MISCITPHLGEELWSLLGHNETIAYEKWPSYDESKTVDSSVTIAVQINGKLRSTIVIEKCPTSQAAKTLGMYLCVKCVVILLQSTILISPF